MTSAAASADRPVDTTAGGEDVRRLWPNVLTFVVYLLTGGLYGIWWFFVSRREMAEELDRRPSPAIGLLEGILHLVPLVNAYVWYRVITDLNALRTRVGAPAVSLWSWVTALILPIPCIFILPEVLGPLLDAFNNDMRGIIRALGYAAFPAQVLVFAWMVGYWNEYWLERTGERAERRRFGVVDWILYVVALGQIAGLVLLGLIVLVVAVFS